MNHTGRSPRQWSTGGLSVIMLLLAHLVSWAQVLHLPLDGNGLDASGNNHHGQVYGTQPTSDRFGRAGRALIFNGVSDCIQVPDHSQLRARALSISLWFKVCSPSSNPPRNFYGPALICKGYSATGDAYLIYFQSPFPPAIEFAALGNWSGSNDGASGPPIPTTDGRWHHCVGEVVDTGGTWWLDGGLWIDGVGSAIDNLHHYLLANIVADIYIGRNSISNRYFKGAIDDVRLYDRLLSNEEIQALYAEGGWPNVTLPPLNIQVATPPVVDICPGDSLELRATVTGSYDRLVWRASPSEYIRDSGSTTITVRPTVTTTYRIHATLGEPCPERRDSAAVTVRVRPGPKFPPLGPKMICPGDSVTIGAPATGGTVPYRYQWRSAPGIADPGGVTQRVSPPSSRWYHIEVTDVNGCRRRDSVLVAVPGFPKLALPARRMICRGSPDTIGVQATGGSGAGYRYKWTPSVGLSNDSVAFPLMLVDTSRRYVVRVTDGAGCSTADTMDVVVVDPPAANAGPGIILCADSSTRLGAPRLPGCHYRWTPSLGLDDSTLAQPTARPPSTTTYTVEVTDSATGCESFDSVEVRVVQFAMTASPPTLDFGRLDGCTSSRELALILRNRGNGPLTVAHSVGSGNFLVASSSTSVTLVPSDTATLLVRYAPQSAGTHLDTLVLMADRCGIVQTIILRGAKDAAIASVAPNAVDFGTRLVCDTAQPTEVAWVHNLGSDPMTVSALVIDAPFTSGALTLPATIPPGDSLRIALTLAAVPGAWAGEGRIAYWSGSCRDTLRIALRGEVVAPTLIFEDPFDIGVIAGCAGGRDTAIMVNNATSLLITIMDIDGGRIVSSPVSLPMTVAPATSASLALRVDPVSPGPFTQRVSVRLAECDTAIAFTLRGDYRGVVFAHVDTVDFGEVIACGDTMVSVPFELLYGGGAGATGRVAAATFDTPFGIDSIAGARLDSGVVYRTRLYFTPPTDGLFAGLLKLTLEPCGVTREIVLTGSRSSVLLVAEPGVVDLGSVNPGATATGEVTYINRGAVAVRVERVGGIAPPFTVVGTKPSTPATLSGGDTLRVTIACVGQGGRWIDTVEAMLSAPCSMMSLAEVRAVTNDELRGRLTANRFVAKGGDHRRVTVTLGEESGLAAAGVRWIETTVRFDGSMLWVEPNQAGVTVMSDSAGWKRVRVRGSLPAAGGEAAGVNVVALLGKSDRTSIVIDDARWLDESDEVMTGIATTVEAGEFALDGVCRQGSDRYVDGLGEFFLRPVIPTPTRGIGEIEFGVVEDGPIKLEIVDMSGRALATVLAGTPGAGVYRVVLDARGLSAGRYMVVLRSGRDVATVGMAVE